MKLIYEIQYMSHVVWVGGVGMVRWEQKKGFLLPNTVAQPLMPTGTWMPLTLILKDTNIISKTLPLCSIFVLWDMKPGRFFHLLRRDARANGDFPLDTHTQTPLMFREAYPILSWVLHFTLISFSYRTYFNKH